MPDWVQEPEPGEQGWEEDAAEHWEGAKPWGWGHDRACSGSAYWTPKTGKIS